MRVLGRDAKIAGRGRQRSSQAIALDGRDGHLVERLPGGAQVRPQAHHLAPFDQRRGGPGGQGRIGKIGAGRKHRLSGQDSGAGSRRPPAISATALSDSMASIDRALSRSPRSSVTIILPILGGDLDRSLAERRERGHGSPSPAVPARRTAPTLRRPVKGQARRGEAVNVAILVDCR